MKRNTLINIYKKILNNIIEKVDKYTFGRHNKFDNYFYLNYILRILFYGEYWIRTPWCSYLSVIHFNVFFVIDQL